MQGIQETMAFPVGDFIKVKLNRVHFYIYLAPPSVKIGQYEEMLDSIVLDARNSEKDR